MTLETVPPDSSTELDVVLIEADVLDIPIDWAIRDLDPASLADLDDPSEFDPFLGLISCSEGTIREGEDSAWRSRQFAATELPLPNGLLSIELGIEEESDEQWEQDRAALDECQVGEQSVLTVTDTELPIAGGSPVPMTTIGLLAAPSEDVPYPSAFDASIVHRGDLTAAVILGGVDMGESFQPLVDQIIAVVLDRMAGS
jgi:hypothetical protein